MAKKRYKPEEIWSSPGLVDGYGIGFAVSGMVWFS